MADSLPTLKPRVQRYSYFDYAYPSYAYETCLILLAIQGPNPEQEVKDVWTKLGYPPAKFFLFPSTNSLPSSICADMGDVIWIGISGTDNFQQIIRYANPIDAFSEDETTSPTPKFNRTFVVWGNQVKDKLIDYLKGRKPRVALHGHSYGGAVALTAAVSISLRSEITQINVVTFGSPKVGNPAYNEGLENVRIRRWMNNGDPIPALPPSAREVGEPLSLRDSVFLRFLGPSARQTEGGLLMNKLGQYAAGEVTTLTPDLIHLLTLEDEDSFDPQRFTYHYLTTYRDRLLMAAVREAYEQGVNFYLPAYPEIKTSGIPVVKTHVAIDRRLLRAMEIMRVPLEERGFMIEPAVSPYVPKPSRPIVQKFGVTGWQLNWMGETICIDVSRSRCHTLGKALGKFLRRSIVTQNVQILSFIDAWNAFVAEAMAGGKGFRPDIADFRPS